MPSVSVAAIVPEQPRIACNVPFPSLKRCTFLIRESRSMKSKRFSPGCSETLANGKLAPGGLPITEKLTPTAPATALAIYCTSNSHTAPVCSRLFRGG